jgi:hypothetical protein
MRDACHAFAAKSYSWDRVFDRYFEIYRELVAANPLAEALA